MELNSEYWDTRYKSNQTGWDIGYPSPPIIEYFNTKVSKDAQILIPGCGNAYEADALLNQGYKHITLLDFSQILVDFLKNKYADISNVSVIKDDIFQHNGQYDIIVEQTIFCAIDPTRRREFLDKIHSLLSDKGNYFGVLFNRAFEGGPPFGGTEEEYKQLFNEKFEIIRLEPCYNSIPQRLGSEFFFQSKKKFSFTKK